MQTVRLLAQRYWGPSLAWKWPPDTPDCGFLADTCPQSHMGRSSFYICRLLG